MGVPGVDMFLVDDLRTGRAMTMVCRNLASLCRVAVRDFGWTGPTIGPRLATPGPKTWKDVEFNPYQQPEEAIPQSELEEMLAMYKGMLEKEQQVGGEWTWGSIVTTSLCAGPVARPVARRPPEA